LINKYINNIKGLSNFLKDFEEMLFTLKSFLSVSIFLLVSACASSPFISLGGTDERQRSIYIKTFELQTSNAPSNLALDFTKQLCGQLQKEAKFILSPQKAELNFSGAITGYKITSIAPTGELHNDFELVAARQRLTIAVKVQYANCLDESQNFDQEFSFFADFDNTQNLMQVEPQLIHTIFDQIILDILNKSVANW
jgi:hypothetical protein